MSLTITITGDAAQAAADLGTLPGRAVRGIADAMDYENGFTVARIQQHYLRFPSDGPPSPIGCRHITGRLFSSLRASAAQIEGQAVVSSIGSNLKYAAVQEFGVDEEVTVSPHFRRRTSTQKVFGKKKTVQGGDIGVRAYRRHMKITGRGFVQRGITDRLPAYSSAISKVIVDAWNNKT